MVLVARVMASLIISHPEILRMDGKGGRTLSLEKGHLPGKKSQGKALCPQTMADTEIVIASSKPERNPSYRKRSWSSIELLENALTAAKRAT